MKKLAIPLFATLILASALGFFMWHIKSAQSAAIREVLAEREKAHEVFQNPNIIFVVRLGDTLPLIADQMRTTVPALRSANKMPPFGRIAVGQSQPSRSSQQIGTTG
jgi:LysM domain-containing protein